MNRPLLIAASVATVFLATFLTVAWANEAPAASEPSTSQAASEKDWLRGSIDPFHENQERARFLKGAGVDLELSRAEFEAGKNSDGFARAYERWEVLLRFDANRDGLISWFEAQSYRHAMRSVVLSKFDVNRDNRLTGSERTNAAIALRSDLLPNLFNGNEVSRSPLALSPTGSEVKRFVISGHPLAGLDSDGDGRISVEEAEAYELQQRAAWRQQFERNRRNVLARFDTNGNGRLDEDERRVFLDSLMQLSQARYDANGDGQVTGQERGAWDKSYDKRFFTLREEHDTDGDGLLSDEENQNFYKALTGTHEQNKKKNHHSLIEKARELERPYDINSDGILDKAELEAMRRDLESSTR